MELKQKRIIIVNIDNINSDRLITCSRIKVNGDELMLTGKILIDRIYNELSIFCIESGVRAYRIDIDKIESFSCEIRSYQTGEATKPICTISDINCLDRDSMTCCLNIKVNSQLICEYGNIYISDYNNALLVYDKEGKLINPIFRLNEITDFSCDWC